MNDFSGRSVDLPSLLAVGAEMIIVLNFNP
jgi:hypothetical protein